MLQSCIIIEKRKAQKEMNNKQYLRQLSLFSLVLSHHKIYNPMENALENDELPSFEFLEQNKQQKENYSAIDKQRYKLLGEEFIQDNLQ